MPSGSSILIVVLAPRWRSGLVGDVEALLEEFAAFESFLTRLAGFQSRRRERVRVPVRPGSPAFALQPAFEFEHVPHGDFGPGGRVRPAGERRETMAGMVPEDLSREPPCLADAVVGFGFPVRGRVEPFGERDGLPCGVVCGEPVGV